MTLCEEICTCQSARSSRCSLHINVFMSPLLVTVTGYLDIQVGLLFHCPPCRFDIPPSLSAWLELFQPYVQSQDDSHDLRTVSSLGGISSCHHPVWQTAAQRGRSDHRFQIASSFEGYFLGPSSSDFCLEMGQMQRQHLTFWWQPLRVARLISVGSKVCRPPGLKEYFCSHWQKSWNSTLS